MGRALSGSYGRGFRDACVWSCSTFVDMQKSGSGSASIQDWNFLVEVWKTKINGSGTVESFLPHASGKLARIPPKTKILHRALWMWHRDDFSLMESQLTMCKRATLFFNRIEEQRPLARHEFKLRCKIKERAYELANNLEERWRQRSCCNWLK